MAFATINKGSSYFNPVLYTGTGASNSVTGVGFKPDWVWIKSRSLVRSNQLNDIVRGAGIILATDNTSAEFTDTNRISSFNVDGFSLGTNDNVNGSGATYVGWNWLGSNTTASNTNGSITSTVSANTTSGFSIVGYTGTAANATVGHGLGVAPKMIIVKNRSAVAQWEVYHVSTGNTSAMQLSGTGTPDVSSTYWNNTTPTSTLFSIGTGTPTNGSGNSIIAYCFAEVKGYSKFGSYTGNGSTDGPFVYTGFKPAYVMIKNSTFASQSWWISDNKRTTYNVASTTGNFLAANISDAEVTSGNTVDFLSNGFKIRTAYDGTNNSGSTPIYMAFAENPFVLTDGTPVTAR